MKKTEKRKIKIPGMGMRIIKSAIAVAICYGIDLLRGSAGMVFYSQLAALWCIQMYRSNTKKNAVQRIIGTFVGAFFGLIYLLLYPYIIEGVRFEVAIEAIIVAVCIALVLYTTVLLDKKQSSYFSCVVFLSIAINHAGDTNPYLFVWNRFLDTMIGIFIGVIVNDIRICLKPDKETLFISGLDDTLLDQKEMLSPFSKVELNRMIESGMKFTIATIRTPASLIEPMRDVNLKLPVIAMDGAVLYDTNTHEYLKVYVISSDTSTKLMNKILEEKLCWYANVIIDDMLIIYYGELDETNQRMVDSLRFSAYRNYVKRPLPKDEGVAYFMLLDTHGKILDFYEKIKAENIEDELKIVIYPSDDYPGYAYMKIYNKNACKENMIDYLKQSVGLDKCITFGTIPGRYDVVIKSDNANEVVRRVRSMYEPFIRRKK